MRVFGGDGVDRSLWGCRMVCMRASGVWIEGVWAGVEGRRMGWCSWRGRSGLRMPWLDFNGYTGG